MGADPLAEQAIDAVTAAGGRHHGTRALHAKGTFCAGRFTPAADAAALCDAPQFTQEVEVLARFSNGSGNPAGADNEILEGRGLGLKFLLPDDAVADLVMLTLPCFPVRTPEDFVAFTRARIPDPQTGQPDAAALGAFLAAHPETQAALGAIAPSFGPPVSYATCAFNAIHTFLLGAQRRPVRWRLEPEAGEAKLDPEAIAGAGPDYLQDELRTRLGDGEAAFRLVAILAGEQDDVDDPTVPWPADRERVDMGRLVLDRIVEDREQGDHIEVFDPTRTGPAIAPSDDPILHFRRRAYDVSATRRWSGAPLTPA